MLASEEAWKRIAALNGGMNATSLKRK